MNEIDECIEILRSGGVIIYPTDTIWGIGCDATNEKALARLSQIKKRNKEGYIILVSDDKMLMNHVKEIPETAWEIIDSGQSPITLILDEGMNLASEVLATDNSVAVRMIKEGFAHEVLKKFKRPITSTSANFSGSPSPNSFDEIEAELLDLVDFVASSNEDISVTSKPSSIVKITTKGEVEIIRR